MLQPESVSTRSSDTKHGNPPIIRKITVCSIFLVGIMYVAMHHTTFLSHAELTIKAPSLAVLYEYPTSCRLYRAKDQTLTFVSPPRYPHGRLSLIICIVDVFVPGNIWTRAELHISLICACLSTIRPIFSRVFRRGFGATGTDSSSLAFYSRGCQRTTSFSKVKSNKDVDSDARPLTNTESALYLNLSHGNGDSTGAQGGDDVELGDLTFTSRQEADRVLDGAGIDVHREVDVFTQLKRV